MVADMGDDDGEYTPLVRVSGSSQRSKKESWIPWLKDRGLIVLIVLVVILHFRNEKSSEEVVKSNKNAPPPLLPPPVPVVTADGGGIGGVDGNGGVSGPGTSYIPTTTMYRPFCLTHDGTRTARILQTSMGAPSQQWSHIPCYEQSKETQSWTGLGKTKIIKPDVKLNSFGAPDSIMQLNLSQVAHPTRTTPIIGFGNAFTEASALNYATLSDIGKTTLMELLYGSTGLGYSLGRVHINSCDFSVKSYSFDDTDGDFDLKDFDMNVTHDVNVGMVDMILRAKSTFRANWAGKENGDGQDGNFKMYASPWSPPSWMKAPTPDDKKGASHAENMTNSAQPTCLREGVGPNSRYAKAWALYFSKFITAYRNLGVPMWAVTVQNEPEFPAPWEACSYTPTTQEEFVANHLGPQLAQDHPETQIFMFDHNKDHVITWARKLLNESSPSSKYINGTSVHWYAGGMDRLLDGGVGAANMHRLQHNLDLLNVSADHIVMGSEACHCPTTGYAGGDIQIYWSRAERYAHTILSDLAAGSNGWVEWNLLLDSIGGPNHLKNLCDTPILAVPHRAINGSDIPPTMEFEKAGFPFGKPVGDGRTREELNALGFPARFLDVGLAVQPMYYYMGHISRYVRPGSRAVMAIVEESRSSEGGSSSFRAFRPPGQVVTGGGLNDLARDGVEVTAWPCEGSTRQQFKLNELNQLQVFGHDWLGNSTVSCVKKVNDISFLGVTLGDCKKQYATFDMVPSGNDDGLVSFVLSNPRSPSPEPKCLILKELRNNGGAYGPRGGAQVAFANCTEHDDGSSLWKYEETTGEITSTYLPEGEVCMTTGWPFLQIGAFSTPNNGESDTTIVILNEANDAANYVLYDNDQAILSGSIPKRSIQTVLMGFD